MKRILLATTFRLRDLEKTTFYLKKWKQQSGLHIMALIEASEIESDPAAAKALATLVDKVIAYESVEDERPDNDSRKTSPSIKKLIEILSSEEDYDYLGFTNADIEISRTSNDNSFCESIHKLSQGKKAVFAHRRDYTSDKKNYKTYIVGFDLFMLPARLIKKTSFSPGLQFFQVGQVGWDYMLPLSLRAEDVTTTSGLPIFHQVHKSGSTSDWSRAIISCIDYIDPTWTDRKPIKKCSLKVSASTILLLRDKNYLGRTLGRLKEPLYYLLSRFLYYGIIESLLTK